jgi:hypothetical protein
MILATVPGTVGCCAVLGGAGARATPTPPVPADWSGLWVCEVEVEVEVLVGAPVPPVPPAADADEALVSANSARTGMRTRVSGKTLSFVSRRG